MDSFIGFSGVYIQVYKKVLKKDQNTLRKVYYFTERCLQLDTLIQTYKNLNRYAR